MDLSHHTNTEHPLVILLKVFRQACPPQRVDCWNQCEVISVTCLSQEHNDGGRCVVVEHLVGDKQFLDKMLHKCSELKLQKYSESILFYNCS